MDMTPVGDWEAADAQAFGILSAAISAALLTPKIWETDSPETPENRRLCMPRFGT